MRKCFSTLAFLVLSLFATTSFGLQAHGSEKKSVVESSDKCTSDQNAISSASSGYGEISATTGRPKTVHVKGYYRKNGTYVQPHYRSSSRRK
jgi:hypothetical protein